MSKVPDMIISNITLMHVRFLYKVISYKMWDTDLEHLIDFSSGV